MTTPTVPVTVTLVSQEGVPYQGVTVRARLDVNEIYQGIVISDEVSAVTDAGGVAVLNCFPNAPSPSGLGSQGSTYRFWAAIPNGRSMNLNARVLNAPCRLENILVDTEGVPLSAAELAILQAQGSANAAAASAAQAQVSADAANASVVAATAQAGVATTQAGISTTNRAAIDNRLYPGTYSLAPTTRPDGSAIQNGDRYVNSTDGYEYIRLAGSWTSASVQAQAAAASAADAQNWAAQTGADVTGAPANSRSAKSWAVEDLTPAGQNKGGSSKDWATSASKPDGTNESAKTYAANAQLYASAVGAKFYDTIALGRAAVADGATFGVKAGGSDGLTRPTLYRRDSSSTQTLILGIVPGTEYDGSVQRWNVIGGEPGALQAANDTTTAGHVIFTDAAEYSGIPRITLYGGSAGGNVTVRAFTRSGSTWTYQRDLSATIAVPANAQIQVTGIAAINAGEYVALLIPTNGIAYRTTPTSRAVRSGGYVNGSGGSTTFTTAAVIDSKEPQARVEVLAPIVTAAAWDDVKSRLAGIQYGPEIAAYAAGRSASIAAGNPTTYTGERTVIYAAPITIGGLLRLQIYGGPNSGRARVRRYSFDGTNFNKVGHDIPIANIVANSLNVIQTNDFVYAGDYLGLTFDDQTVSIDTALATTGAGFYLYSAGGAEVYIIAAGLNPSTDQLAIRFEVFSSNSAASSTGTTVFLGDSILAQSSNVINNVYGARRGENTVNGGMGGTKIASTYAVGDTTAQYLAPLSAAAVCACIGSGNFAPLTTAANDLYTFNPSLDYRSIVANLAAVNWANVGKLIIFSGTNDFGGNGPIGVSSDTLATAGVRGAINSISANVLATYPQMQIFFVSPYWRSRINPGDGRDADTNANSLGLYLRDYVAAIIDQANQCKLPALDFYKNSGINKTNASVAIPDGLHPGGATWNTRIGAKIAAWIGSVAA